MLRHISFACMKISELHYLKEISIKSIRNAILDYELTDCDTIVLNANDFDGIVIEYRNTFGVSIELPYFLIGVLIDEDKTGKVFEGRIGVIKNDLSNPAREIEQSHSNSTKMEIVYRCGWCGNIVDYDGIILYGEGRSYAISQIEKYGNQIVKVVTGDCCKDKNI
jgi:hypothetical protein